MTKRTSNGDNKLYDPIRASERAAVIYEDQLVNYIKKHHGEFLRAENNSLHVIIDSRRVPLTHDRDDLKLAGLMLDACQVTTLTQAAQAAIQRLQVRADREAGNLTFSRFSALTEDYARLYIPIAGGDLLAITADDVKSYPNGRGPDRFWVEHPYQNPFTFSKVDAKKALSRFESLLVEAQACAIPSMRWLVAMHEGFFPFVRSICAARFLLVHIGGTQQGKTTAAQRFTLLHGLCDVKGDYSVAALANSGDIGLLVMDNKEQVNLEQSLIDFCLFLSTGAERGRSQTDGQLRRNSSRPVGVLTSIEGPWKTEFVARCVEVRFQITGGRANREDNEDEIRRFRSEILSGMISVLQVWLGRRSTGTQRWWEECPMQNFDRHLSVLAGLLCAFGEVAGKPGDWAAGIVKDWCKHLRDTQAEDDDALEYPIMTILEAVQREPNERIVASRSVRFGDDVGTLYVAEPAAMLFLLQKNGRWDIPLPKNPSGLSRRLKSAKFRGFQFLDEDIASQLPQLKRTAKKRSIGFFVPDDDVTAA